MFGLYLHIPFCTKICYYCDFFVDKNVENIDKYVSYLCKEIDIFFSDEENYQKYYKSNLDSIYIGGGTPSLLTPDNLSSIVAKLKQYYVLVDNIEFSFESNPGSITYENLLVYKSLGVNRISIGVQSFNKRELGFLKRSHSPKMAIKAIENAHKSGFDNINLDLIFAIPGQTLDTWKNSLDLALSLDTHHISTYALMYEKGTPLYRDWQSGKVQKKNDEEDAEFYLYTIQRNQENGFEQYEVSNFARDQKYCHHNLSIWHQGEYFAFGVSSHGNLGDHRYNNFNNLEKYYKHIDEDKLPIQKNTFLDFDDRFSELIFLELRSNGLDLNKLTGLFKTEKIDFQQIIEKNRVKKLIHENYIKYSNTLLQLTSKGYAVCDSVTYILVEELESIKNLGIAASNK